MIHALQQASPLQREVLVNAIENTAESNLEEVLVLIRETGAIEASRAAAWQEAQRAIDALDMLRDTPHKRALIALASSLQGRES
jgi:octaprenyl-diphosphate synthase